MNKLIAVVVLALSAGSVFAQQTTPVAPAVATANATAGLVALGVTGLMGLSSASADNSPKKH